MTSPGVPDAHATAGPPLCEFWVEFKRTSGWTVPLEVEQVGWIKRHVRHGGRAYVAVRRLSAGGPRSPPADELYLLWGGGAAAVRAGGLRAVVGNPPALPRVLLGSWAGGPAAWDWGTVGGLLVINPVW
jgi:hypothetical protein